MAKLSLGMKRLMLRREFSSSTLTSLTRSHLGYNHFSYTILSCLAGALIVFTLSLQENKAVYHLNNFVTDLTTPLVNAVSRPFAAVSFVGDFFRSHEALRAEIENLRSEKEFFTMTIQSLRQQNLDYQELHKITQVPLDAKVDRVVARVIGRITDGVNTQFTIRTHKDQGIMKDQPVVTAEGVVGRISKVGKISDSTARVMPLTDLSSRIPVEIESTQEHGVVAGQNGSLVKLIHLEKSVKIKVGDRLITSGYGGIFPRGLPVATITRITSDTIEAQPFVSKAPSFVTILSSSFVS